MAACSFVIPGDINLPTGGYGYDRRVLALLPKFGINVRHLAIAGGYPFPSAADIAAALNIFSTLPEAMPLLIDGLALGAMPAGAVRGIRQPVVALCHHPLALEAGLASEHVAALRASETEALAASCAIVVTSSVTKQLLVREFAVAATKVVVAEPGTDPAARATRNGMWREGAPLQMLAVGSIVPRKGYDVLVRALAALPERNWCLTIAGADDRAPETTAAVRRLIAATGLGEHCRMIGPVDTVRLGALYAAADLFVMPSLFEGYGMVLGEAMARGLPIVCTTGGAAAETAPDTAAIKVRPGDVEALSKAVQSVLRDEGLRRSMADAAWAAGQSLPRWEDTARIIAGVIRKAAP